METARLLSNPFTGDAGDKCFGCSKTNSHGLHLEFAEDGDSVFCRWKPDARFQSWDGVLHGGITTTILDETAGWATMRRFQRSAMTTRIEIKFLKPARIDTAFFVSRAKYVCQVNEKIARFHATLEDADGLICAEADADYYVMDEQRSKAMGFTSCGPDDVRGGVKTHKSEKTDMTNKELRDRGELYDANYDPELVRLMDECKDKCWEYNQIKPSNWAAKDAKLREIIGSVGAGVRVQAPFWCDYGSNITFGENFYANHGLVILDGAKVVFGKNVFVAPNCGFHTAGHPLDAERRNKGLEYARPITVGDNVWFGANVVVLPGVTIGDGAVIGAGSVVTKDVPPNVVAVGNPCRVLREINQVNKD